MRGLLLLCITRPLPAGGLGTWDPKPHCSITHQCELVLALWGTIIAAPIQVALVTVSIARSLEGKRDARPPLL